ncbi:MAG: 2-oxo acid dehydrogenase subunit E2 [Myxococcota bacterium]
MKVAALVVAVVFVAWIALHARTSRPDGRALPMHPFRRLLLYLLPSRNGAVVYFDAYPRAEKLLAWLEKTKDRCGANVTHAAVAGCFLGLASTPRMNRFVVGNRLYERDGRWITFSMKRQKMDRAAQLSTVKLRIEDGESFRQLCERINGGIGQERSGKKTKADKEIDFFNFFPRPLLRAGAALLAKADEFGLLPGWYIREDPMYTSIFLANLGSLGMGAGYHHLFEYGNCPLFIMLGQVEDKPVVEDGKVVVGKVLHVRFTYEERIDDGLNARFGIEALVRVLEDPDRWLGGTDDASDFALWPREDWVEKKDAKSA